MREWIEISPRCDFFEAFRDPLLPRIVLLRGTNGRSGPWAEPKARPEYGEQWMSTQLCESGRDRGRRRLVVGLLLAQSLGAERPDTLSRTLAAASACSRVMKSEASVTHLPGCSVARPAIRAWYLPHNEAALP